MNVPRRQVLKTMLAAPAILRGLQAAEFAPTWESLADYRCPDWFRDAKFGIFMHWGLPAVTDENRPFGTGHYANGMYYQHGRTADGKPIAEHLRQIYDFHVKRYGHPSKFGYKDFVPMWRAEKWNPDELAALYKRCGARYIVPVAVHHDNFEVFESEHRWNAKAMGPKRDILAGWKQAAERHGLRFGCSSHLDRAFNFLAGSHTSDYEGPLRGIAYDGSNPANADLYLSGLTIDQWKQKWFQRTQALVRKYSPDILYFDGGLPYDQLGLRVASEYYSRNAASHGGRCEAVLNLKRGPDKRAFVWDIERGQCGEMQPHPWQTDTTLISGWFYHKAGLEMTSEVAIANLADIVSKNGNLLLNVGLRPDGTLPENQTGVLEDIGSWLHVNGEAIHGTRPWKTYGEGPTRIETGSFKEQKSPFTEKDVRFTTRGRTIYAIFLAPPKGAAAVRSLGSRADTPIRSVALMGSGQPLSWRVSDEGLEVTLPDRLPAKWSPVLKIETA